MDQRTGKHSTPPDRAETAERRLKTFYDPDKRPLDRAEIRASRDFHLQHWLRLAEAAIQNDHRSSFYEDLAPGLESLLADYPDDRLPPERQEAVMKDLAFLEGHLQAYRIVNDILERARRLA